VIGISSQSVSRAISARRRLYAGGAGFQAEKAFKADNDRQPSSEIFGIRFGLAGKEKRNYVHTRPIEILVKAQKKVVGMVL